MFGLGPTELVIVALVGLILFGNRLPDVLRNCGRGIRGFQEEMQGVREQVKEVVK